VGGSPIELLVDTGATVDLLDYSVYCSLDLPHRTALKETKARLHGADGKPLDLLGETEVKIDTGEGVYSIRMVVAKLGSLQGILGMRFLQKETCSIDTVSGHLTCGDVRHQLHHVKTKGCCRVRLVEGITLAGGEETLVHGCFDGDELVSGPAILEQDSNGLVGLGLMLPRALVQAGRPEVAFTIANFGKTLKLLPSTPVAMVNSVEVITDPVFKRGQVASSEKGNLVGPVGGGEDLPLPQGCPPGTKGPLERGGPGAPLSQPEEEGLQPLPEHLQALYDQAVPGLNEHQARGVQKFKCRAGSRGLLRMPVNYVRQNATNLITYSTYEERMANV
jgi:predicted aspartyl protease